MVEVGEDAEGLTPGAAGGVVAAVVVDVAQGGEGLRRQVAAVQLAVQREGLR
jgi:hypothetical protein